MQPKTTFLLRKFYLSTGLFLLFSLYFRTKKQEKINKSMETLQNPTLPLTGFAMYFYSYPVELTRLFIGLSFRV